MVSAEDRLTLYNHEVHYYLIFPYFVDIDSCWSEQSHWKQSLVKVVVFYVRAYFKNSGSFYKEMSYLCVRKWKYIHKEHEVDCKLAIVVLVTPSGSLTPRTTHTYTPHPTPPNPNTSPQGCLCSFLLFHHFDLALPSFTKLTLYLISNQLIMTLMYPYVWQIKRYCRL